MCYSYIKRPYLRLGLPILLFALLAVMVDWTRASAQMPNTVTVRMYTLYDNGSINYETGNPLCQVGDNRFGCTLSNSYRYPYPTNPASVQIDGTPQTLYFANNTPSTVKYQYLHDVVAKEAIPSLGLPVAFQAQAIASRSYAYWHAQRGTEMTNSNSKQVYIPGYLYAPDRIPYQAFITNAVATKIYMSEGGNSNAIFAEYSSEAGNVTATGGYPGLLSVPDPISQVLRCVGCHGHGLSQYSSYRWARGNTGWNSSSPTTAWSVKFTDSYQMLTHYYTGIHIRDANNPSTILTPNDRWVPLQLEWDFKPEAPRFACKGKTHVARVTVQNTGTTTWYVNGADRYTFEYNLSGVPGNPSLVGRPKNNIAPGGTFDASLWVTIPSNFPGSSVDVTFIMKKNGVPFTNWSAYSLGNLRYGDSQECKHSSFFPSMRRGATNWWPTQ